MDTRPLEERVAARKQELLIQKRRELAKVLDKHDDLVSSLIYVAERPCSFDGCSLQQVREAFHLERFVTLVSFDPKVRGFSSSLKFMVVFVLRYSYSFIRSPKQTLVRFLRL